MNSNCEKLIGMCCQYFDGGENIQRTEIHDKVNLLNSMMTFNLKDEELEYVKRKLETIIPTTMGGGETLTDQKHTPWLQSRKAEINPYYWSRYKKLLNEKQFGPEVVNQTDIITDEILDLLQDPKIEGRWQRKGLVVGHVQSGKTANYTGLICKAFDSGYKIVIVLAGLLNSLRKQTQERGDEGIVGINSAIRFDDRLLVDKLIGVGKFDHEYTPVTITTVDSDFNRAYANQNQQMLQQYNDPVLFIIKKNVNVIKNVTDWLKANNFDLSKFPLLLIDDEADHATINTRDSHDPTTTNIRIRELLEIFPKNAYIGYTATPFANIFINPETPEEMMNDLFPENFIKSLDPPSNYFGGHRIYVKDELNCVRYIKDYQDILPIKHKIDDHPEILPLSLKESIQNYILVCAIRITRYDGDKNNSMLVNVSRFTGIQGTIRQLIHAYLVELVDSIRSHYALNKTEALKNNVIKTLYDLFYSEYSKINNLTWDSIQKNLNNAASKIQVIEVNGSQRAEKDIDYSKRNYPNGRSIIAVGGLSLSRGITLEGLSISYFLRNSYAYDTLMQMGRWFGYRPGYEDLCRVYMTEESAGYYEHITNATDELRQEFDRMSTMDPPRTPKDFGLAVRNHPEALIVTALNKMRSATKVYRSYNLTSATIQTSYLLTNKQTIESNLNAAGDLYTRLNNIEDKRLLSKHKVWNDINASFVIDFLEQFENHSLSAKSDPEVINKYIREVNSQGILKKWNIVFASPGKSNEIQIPKKLEGVMPSLRKANVRPCNGGILLSQRSLLAENIRTIDLDDSMARRDKPLLIIYLLDCRKKDDQNIPWFSNGIIAYGMQFPGSHILEDISIEATYQANTTYAKQYFGDTIEDADDLGVDIDD